ncbi:transcriptional regulator, IclR family [Actinobacteria bacterium OK074]|nr:transcriptional regulator, IclR family [Actinobacteria bacterium OK074]
MTSALCLKPRSEDDGHALPPSMMERVTLIMDLFERPQTHLTLETVSRRTHLPRSTTHRILDQLVRLDWLHHTVAGYVLGPRALGLGGREIGHSTLRAAAAPLLLDLAVRTKMVVHLAVLDGPDIYYLDKVGGRAAVDIPSRVGGRAFAHCTGLGKAMLAWLSPEEIDARYERVIERRTPHSIGRLDLLHRELGAIRRRNGLAVDRGECFPALGCVGLAVRGPEGPVAAISVVGDGRSAIELVAPAVVDTVRAVSKELFGTDRPYRRDPADLEP